MQRVVLVIAVVVGWGDVVRAQNSPPAEPIRENVLRSGPGAQAPSPVGPNQPVKPVLPTLERRTTQQPAPPPPAPFQLAPQEQAWRDQILDAWEKESQKIKTFDCSFKRWEYERSLPQPNIDPNQPRTKADLNKPTHIEWGIIKYAAPDKGRFQTTYTELPDGKREPIRESKNIDRAEQWICDGKSVFQYDYPRKQLNESPLPPDLQGKAIADGPLPFIFGAEAQKLRHRYFLRIITPADAKEEIWIEAYPRFQEDAANFQRVVLTLETPKLAPKALLVFYPGGNNRASYQFYDVVVNDLLRPLQGNPFRANMPRGWNKVTHPPQVNQAQQPPPGLR